MNSHIDVTAIFVLHVQRFDQSCFSVSNNIENMFTIRSLHTQSFFYSLHIEKFQYVTQYFIIKIYVTLIKP